MAQPVASSKGLPAVHSATAAAPAPITDPLTVVNQKVKALYMRMLSKGSALGLPEYRDLFIEYGKAFVASKAAEKAALAKGFETCVVLIEKQQKRPELTRISEVAFKTIKHIPNPADFGPNEIVNKFRFVGDLQQKLSDLVAAKEILVLSQHAGDLHIKQQTAVDATRKLAPKEEAYNGIPNADFFDGVRLGIVEAMQSQEAFALYCRFATLANKERLKQSMIMIRDVSSEEVQELTRCKDSADPHVRTMANIILVFSMADAALSKYGNAIENSTKFLNTSKILFEGKNPVLQDLIPEFALLREMMVKFIDKARIEMAANPNDETVDPMYSKACIEHYGAFNAVADQTYFAYRFMHEIWKAQGGFELTNGRLLRYSHCFRAGDLPTPEAFAALAPDHVIIDKAVKNVRMGKGWIEETFKVHNALHKKPTILKTAASHKEDKPRNDANKKTEPSQYKTASVTAAAPAVASTATAAAPAAVAVVAPTFAQIVAQRAFSIDHLTYADRVNIWFTDPDTALAQKPYVDQPALHAEFVLCHTLPILLDDLIGTSYCLADEWENKAGERSDLYCFVGEIEDADGSISRGVLTMAVDAGGVCWHRCWSKKTNKELLEQKVNEMIFETDFPPLEAASKQTTKKKSKQAPGKSADPLVGAFGIMEIKLGAGRILRLFPCASNPD